MPVADHTDLLQVAQILKSNGTGGELVMSFRDTDPDDIDTTEPVYIYVDGLPVPFFIESMTRRGNSKALVHLTDIESFEDAEELVGQAVYMSPEALGEEDGDEEDLSFLVGWTLCELKDGGMTEVGEIVDFVDIPGNPCLEVSFADRSVIVPLHEDLLEGLDREQRLVVMTLPEGLLDL